MPNSGEPEEHLRNQMVSVWRSPKDYATVVQIDSGEIAQRYQRRVRVVLNEAVLYDGNPETDEPPGPIAWEDVVVSEEVALNVLSFFEGVGQRTGQFEESLIRTILHADDRNSELLGFGFREYVRAVGLWRSNKHLLHEIVGR